MSHCQCGVPGRESFKCLTTVKHIHLGEQTQILYFIVLFFSSLNFQFEFKYLLLLILYPVVLKVIGQKLKCITIFYRICAFANSPSGRAFIVNI